MYAISSPKPLFRVKFRHTDRFGKPANTTHKRCKVLFSPLAVAVAEGLSINTPASCYCRFLGSRYSEGVTPNIFLN